MMTKRDYVTLAEAIAAIADHAARSIAADAVAKACQRQNPLFKRSVFMTACNADSMTWEDCQNAIEESHDKMARRLAKP